MTTTPAPIQVKTILHDGRCTDGCCGDVSLGVPGPKGEMVYADVRALGALGRRVDEIVRLLDTTTEPGRYGGEGVVSYTQAEMAAILAVAW